MIIPIVAGLLVVTFWVVFVGAPYVPTRQRDIDRLFDIASIKKGEGRIIDLGSGDGRLQIAAARRGIASTGYELSLPLVLVSWWRLRRYRSLAEVQFVNFWNQQLPDDTTVVFTFLASKYMKQLDEYLQREADRLQRPLELVSYGFMIEGRKPIKRNKALVVYSYDPS